MPIFDFLYEVGLLNLLLTFPYHISGPALVPDGAQMELFKILTSTVLHRLSKTLEKLNREEQSGFCVLTTDINTSGRVKAYHHLYSLLHSSSVVMEGCSASPFLFKFATYDILEIAVMKVGRSGVNLLLEEKLPDLDYRYCLVLIPITLNLWKSHLMIQHLVSICVTCTLHLPSAEYV